MPRRSRTPILAALLLTGFSAAGERTAGAVNWETPHVHPLDLTPDGANLLAVNTADARLEIFATHDGGLATRASIPVGLDPVSVRARTATEAWVVNAISDSISIVDLATRRVQSTLAVCDEPADVVFAAQPPRAFVSCTTTNRLLVYDAADPGEPLAEVPIAAEEPRALAVSADGSRVFAAIFESGNGTTLLSGGRRFDAMQPPGSVPPDVVSDPDGPHNGLNPPPNDGIGFEPQIGADYLPGGAHPAPEVSLIVRRDEIGRWLDDTGAAWTSLVSGAQAAQSGRVPGWTLPDRDVAIVDAFTLDVTYATGLMNLVMAIAVRPGAGEVTVVGTEATNEIRFEKNLKGRFVRVELARFAPSSPAGALRVDLNAGHLTYSDAQVAQQSNPATASQALRDRSLGDPRAIVWRGDGGRGWIAGLGSNNVAVVGPAGERLAPLGAPGDGAIEVAEGPTGLALDAGRGRLYVLERFAGSVAWIDLASEQVAGRVAFHDATPAPVRAGRRFLYDTRATSGLGQVSCASCHADGRIDRLAWDLGEPDGAVKPLNPAVHNLGMGFVEELLALTFDDFHPMKGPMTTQTLVDIVGKEPFHWRGDRDGLEQFNGTFQALLGDDVLLTPAEMQAFEDFLATLTFPPNPHRNLDNSLRTLLPLPAHRATGNFSLAAGAPLPPGNAVAGLSLYRPPNPMLFGFACSSCHTLPTGSSAAVKKVGDQFVPLPLGPNGEARLGLVPLDSKTNRTLKVPQLRTLADKVGMELKQVESLSGFGFTQDGSTPTLAMFLNSFELENDQQVADMIAFLLSIPGSELPTGSTEAAALEPPGPLSKDTHAAVGHQITFDEENREEPEAIARLELLQELTDAGKIGLVAHARHEGVARGWAYAGAGLLAADRAGESTTVDALRGGATSGAEVTFTAVPAGEAWRLGVDRDGDGHLDRDELDQCADPADPASAPDATCLFRDDLETGDTARWSASSG